MALKPKTARRLLLLAVLVLVGAGAIFAFFGVRRWQNERRSIEWRTQGMAAFEAKNYFETLNQLGRYVQKFPNDKDVLLTWAKAREKIENADGSHLMESARFYERYLDQDPGDKATARHLVTLYLQSGLWNEARDRAQRLRPQDLAKAELEHRELLMHEAQARIAIKAADPRAGELITRALELDAADVIAQAQYARWLRDMGRGVDIAPYIEKLRKGYGDQEWCKLAIAIISIDDKSTAQGADVFQAATTIANIDPATGDRKGPSKHGKFIKSYQLISLFDLAYRFNHSMSVMQEELRTNPDSDLRPIVARRLWQSGASREALDVIPAKLDLSPNGTHTDLLVFKIVASLDAKAEVDHAQILKAMEERSDDFRARSWLPPLRSLVKSPPPPASESVVELLAAIKDNPREPILHYWLGSRYAELGRDDEARDAWRRAGELPLSNGWATPWIRISNSLLDAGRFEPALETSALAVRISPGSTDANLASINAQVNCLDAGIPIPGGEGPLLDSIERLIAQNAGSESAPVKAFVGALLPSRVLLLSRAGKTAQARSLVTEALAGQNPPSRNVLQQLASISMRQKLGVEDQVLAFAEKAFGVDPSGVYNRAMSMYRAGQKAEAVTLLREAVKQNAANDTNWRLALARFLDAVGDPAAKDEWIALADAKPEDLRIQLDAMRSPAAGGDSAFIDRVSERVTKLGGGDAKSAPPLIRLAKARSMLSGKPTRQVRDEAVGMLKTLAIEAPDIPEVRKMLVAALLIDDPENNLKPDIASAVEQLRNIASSSSDRSGPILDIARLYQSQRDFAKAKAELTKVTGDPELPATSRTAAADMLIGQGEFAEAIPVLEQLVREGGPTPDSLLLFRLAGVYRSMMRDADALGILRRIIAKPPTDPEQLFQLADGLAALGDSDNAAKAIGLLDKSDLDPARRELLKASYAQRRGKPDEAAAAVERAIAISPNNADAWNTLASLYMVAGDRAKAEAVVKRGLAQIPGEPRLKIYAQQLAGEVADANIDLKSIADSLAKDPANAKRAEAIRALEEMRSTDKLNDPQAWQALADRFQDDPAIQASAAQALSQLNPPQLAMAASIARRAMRNFPAAVEPAKLATFVYRQMGDWSEMLAASKAWQQLTRSRDSDIAVAEANLNTRQPKAAIEQLRPHVSTAAAGPDAPGASVVLSLQGAALIDAGQSRDAFGLLSPIIKSSRTVRNRVFLPLAGGAELPETETRQWFDAAEASAAADSIEDQLSLADAYARLSVRLPKLSKNSMDRSIAILQRLDALPADKKGDQAAKILFGLGAALDRAGDPKAGAEAFRKSLAIQPDSISTMDALARALAADAVARNADPSEAVAIAQRAMELAGGRGSSLSRTLAKCFEAQGQHRIKSGDAAGAKEAWGQAAAIYKQLTETVNPSMADFYLLAQIQETIGQYREAVATYERALAMPAPITKVDRAGLQNNLAYMLLKSDKSASSLNKAKDLAVAASGAVEHAAFYDTLGAIELARGDRDAAAAAYRKGLAADPKQVSCVVGLASALSEGGPKQIDEAKRIIGPLISSDAVASQNDPELSKRFSDVRAKLGL